MAPLTSLYQSALGIAAGMGVTLKNMVASPTVTLQYPDERQVTPDGYRGIPVLLSDREGTLKCIACEKCAKACPIDIIFIEHHRGEDRKKVLDRFDLDVSKCMFCGLCAEACPVDGLAIAMSDIYELGDDDVDNLYWDMNKLQEMGMHQVSEPVNFAIRTDYAANSRR